MIQKECIAMLLAGGQGSRLEVLTQSKAKPAVPFGGKYRIIDFPLSNCVNSGIDTVGVLTQYQPLELNAYLGNGAPWDLDRTSGGVYVLPPYMKGKSGEWYKGTANAIYQNIGFIDQYNPKHVLVLSGDHIYKMDYMRMLQFHTKHAAAATIAVIEVPLSEASRFGIMNTLDDGKIYEFEEKPKRPKSQKASMGVYVFDWPKLREYLIADEADPRSAHDFGKNIIPRMLTDQLDLYAYPFGGYWKDVGTVTSLWDANMDMISSPPRLNLYDPTWRIYSRNPVQPPHYIAPGATVDQSIITEGGIVHGSVKTSVLFAGVTIGEGAVVEDSIVMPGARVERNAHVTRAIIGEKAVVGEGAVLGRLPLGEDGQPAALSSLKNDGIVLIGEDAVIKAGAVLPAGTMLDKQSAKNYQLEEESK